MNLVVAWAIEKFLGFVKLAFLLLKI